MNKDKCLLIPLWFALGILIVYFLFWFDWTPVLAWIRKKREKKVYTNIYGATGPSPWPDYLMTGPTGYTGALINVGMPVKDVQENVDEMKMQQYKNYKRLFTTSPFLPSSPLNMHRDEWVKYKQQFGIPPDENLGNYFIAGSARRWGKTAAAEKWMEEQDNIEATKVQHLNPERFEVPATGCTGQKGLESPAGYTDSAEGKLKRMRDLLNSGAHYSLMEQLVKIIKEPDPAGLPVQEDGHHLLKSFNTIGKAAYFINHNPYPLIAVTVEYRIPKEKGPTGPATPANKPPSYTFGKRPKKKK